MRESSSDMLEFNKPTGTRGSIIYGSRVPGPMRMTKYSCFCNIMGYTSGLFNVA